MVSVTMNDFTLSIYYVCKLMELQQIHSFFKANYMMISNQCWSHSDWLLPPTCVVFMQKFEKNLSPRQMTCFVLPALRDMSPAVLSQGLSPPRPGPLHKSAPSWVPLSRLLCMAGLCWKLLFLGLGPVLGSGYLLLRPFISHFKSPRALPPNIVKDQICDFSRCASLSRHSGFVP